LYNLAHRVHMYNVSDDADQEMKTMTTQTETQTETQTAELLANPCPECGEVEILDTVDGWVQARCPCADRPWDVRDLTGGAR
jgi:hypothetical protein